MPIPITSLPARAAVIALAAIVALGLSGCSSPVLKSSVDVPARYAMASQTTSEPEIAWWESYGDPVLSDLIRRAAYENRDVKIAVERVRAARAGETISRSRLLPSIDLQATGLDRNTGHSSAAKVSLPDVKGAGGGVGVSWEVDLAGGLRAGAAAAASETLAAEHGTRAVRLMVLADVASNYFIVIGTLRQLETVRAIAAAQDETLRLVTARQRAGLATLFDVERAQTEASRAHAAIPPLETVAAVARHRIAVLIGDQAFNAAAIVPSNRELVVPSAQPGQPAALLQRRPDLLALDAQLQAANARRKQAQAEWFPRLFLSALFGRETVELNGVGLGAAHFTNVFGMLAMPIFNAGRTRAINEIAESGQREAVIRYEHGIVRALEDVENTLVTVRDERQRNEMLQAASSSAESALGRAQSLYERGQIDLLPLLDAQRTRLTVRVNANDSNTQLLLDSVQLYKALGGGWQVFEPAGQPAANSDTGSPKS